MGNEMANKDDDLDIDDSELFDPTSTPMEPDEPSDRGKQNNPPGQKPMPQQFRPYSAPPALPYRPQQPTSPYPAQRPMAPFQAQQPGYPPYQPLQRYPPYTPQGQQPPGSLPAKKSTPPPTPMHDSLNDENCFGSCIRAICTFLSYLLAAITFPIAICVCTHTISEYQRAVIFRMGIVTGGPRGPGTFFSLPCIDEYRCLDIRTKTFDIPPQEILTQDSVTILVDAVVYFRVRDPILAITKVENFARSTQLLSASTLRNVLGTKTMAQILSDREHIAESMKMLLDEATDPWGISVERVEMKDVKIPVQLQRAMAAEAEATREAKAKVIAADGEMQASKSLKEASDIMMGGGALQLRYLQTLSSIATEHNSTIIFPLPMDILSAFMKK